MKPEKLVEIAIGMAVRSNDDSTRVGCVIATPELEPLLAGYNTFPRGVDDTNLARRARPAKYSWTVHAETNVIAGMASMGQSTYGMFVCSTQIPCSTCMGIIIQAGIAAVFCPNGNDLDDRWRGDSHISQKMAEEAGVAIHFFEFTEEEKQKLCHRL